MAGRGASTATGASTRGIAVTDKEHEALKSLLDVASAEDAPDWVWDALLDIEGWLRHR